MGGVDGRRAGLAPAGRQLGEEDVADLGIEMGRRLVEEVERSLTGQRPGQSDPLLLAAGELSRPPVRERADAQPIQEDPRLVAARCARRAPRRRSG